MSALQPDPAVYVPMLALAVRQSAGIGGHAPTEDPFERMRARVRDASDRLTALSMARADGPLAPNEGRAIADAAVALAAATIRGLNDCLNAGALDGYVAINENRVSAAVDFQAGPPSAYPDESSNVDPVVDGWLSEVNAHVAPLRLTTTHPDIVVREAFAAVGAAGALAAELMSRLTQDQPPT